MLNDKLDDGIRIATQEDWQALGDITATAFQNDPVSSWTFGDIDALRIVFRMMARQSYLKNGICHLAGSGGATMWLPPGEKEVLPLTHKLSLATGLLRASGPSSIKRTLTLDHAMTKHRPRFPHYYLFTIAVLEHHRGTGLGKRLLEPVLRVADSEGMPTYLENSNPANTGFYMSHGFVSQKIFSSEKGAPPLEAMVRPPKQH